MLQNTKNKKNNYKKMSEEYDYYLDFLLMGNKGVGKTSLLRRYVNLTYYDHSSLTGLDFVRKKNIN